MTKLIPAEYACWFCHERITIESYKTKQPVWVKIGRGSLHLVHKDCEQPAKVADRLMK